MASKGDLRHRHDYLNWPTFSRSWTRPSALFGNKQRAVAGWHATFETGRCRIDVARVPAPFHGSNFAAAMYWCDMAGQGLRPIMFEDGRRAVIHADSELLALSAAIVHLEDYFGRFTEISEACREPAYDLAMGQPLRLARTSS
jgi:hypothetical protein